MREVLDELHRWWRSGHPAGLATVVATFRSAPRPPGAAMLVGPHGAVAGSVSGGCVEGAVYELATEVIGSGEAALARYGVTDDDAFAVGLTCGGVIDVFVERVERGSWPWLDEVAAAVHEGRPVAIATVIAHPDAARVGAHLLVWPEATDGTLGSARVDGAAADDARGLLAAGRSATLEYGPDGQRRGRRRRRGRGTSRC